LNFHILSRYLLKLPRCCVLFIYCMKWLQNTGKVQVRAVQKAIEEHGVVFYIITKSIWRTKDITFRYCGMQQALFAEFSQNILWNFVEKCCIIKCNHLYMMIMQLHFPER